jgi:hypothetical protein
MQNQSFFQTAKEYEIKKFLSENKRLPTQEYLNEKIFNFKNQTNKKLFVDGLNVYFDSEFARFQNINEEVSSSNFNTMLHFVTKDLEVLRNEYLSLISSVENYFKTITMSQDRHYKNLKLLELEINKELLLSNKSDAFTYGVVENFDNHNNNVDFSKSSISILEDGRVTLGLLEVESTSFQNVNIDYFSSSRTDDIVDRRDLFNVRNILSEDGAFFEHIAYTSKQDSIVDFAIHIALDGSSNTRIDKLKVVCRSNSGSSKTNINVYYSLDNSTFIKLDYDSDLEPKNGSNFFDIYQDSVRAIKIVFTKRGYDYKRDRIYGYAFGIDFIGITSAKYTVDNESILYTKAYEVFDENNQPYNFTFATLKHGTCCIIPTQTSVNFYLSKDNVNWKYCNIDNAGMEYVQFEKSNDIVHELVIDDSTTPYLITNKYVSVSNPDVNYLNNIKTNLGIELQDDEALLNYYFSSTNNNDKKIIESSIQLFRDVSDINDAESGWRIVNNRAVTNFVVDDLDGIYIDVGAHPLSVNGRELSGEIYLPKGVHKIISNQSLNLIIAKFIYLNKSTLNNSSNFKNLDKEFYPYNHRYLIKGYPYKNGFSGEKPYIKKGNSFKYKCNYTITENFRFEESSNYEIFTLIKNAYGTFIKVKKNANDLTKELFNLEYKSKSYNETPENKLYLKAVLKSSNKFITPKIDTVQMRVI